MPDRYEASLEPFTHEWCDAGRRLVEHVTLAPDRSCRVQFEVDATRWFISVTGGRIDGWDAGSIERPDVELRWSRDNAGRILTRALRGNAAMLVTTVSAPMADGRYVGRPAPLGLLGRPELRAMPFVPGATLVALYRYRDGPFGLVEHVLRFVDGRLVDERLGANDAPDVTVDVTYRAMALVRAGEMTILEALEDGAVIGEIGPLATLAGISESPEFHAAEIATGRHSIALAVLGELDADPVFVDATERLVQSTRWS